MTSKGYLVVWEIFLEAGSAEEAVQEAVACLAPREPEKWLFGVTDQATGRRYTFDRLVPGNQIRTMNYESEQEVTR